MPRLPLLAGSRVPLVQVGEDAVLIAPPRPLEPLQEIAGAVVEALRYPLSGPSIDELATPGGRATIVVEPPLLPLPPVDDEPRQEALAAVLDELVRVGVPAERHTILIAGGLEQRTGRSERALLLRPDRARGFRGTVEAHDCCGEGLRELAVAGGLARVSPSLLDTDLVVTVTAAETADRGGAAALLACCDAETVARPPAAPSLLEPATSPTTRLAGAVEAALGARVPLAGVSLVLDHPRLTGRYRGYPWSGDAVEGAARSPLRTILNILPGRAREGALRALGRELRATAVLAGPPSVAHAEALLRGIALRGTHLDQPLDTIIVPLPWSAPHQPRQPLNPITAAAASLGLALRLWRERSPLVEGGTIVILHDLARAFGHGPQAPFRELFHALRADPGGGALDAARTAAAADGRAIAAYRRGRSPHPLLPFADWGSTAPVRGRAGRILVAGCRDAAAARALGFVPSHNVATALEMARGVAGGSHRLGVLLAPPYAPIVVGRPVQAG